MPMPALDTHAMPTQSNGVTVGQPVLAATIFADKIPSAIPSSPPTMLNVTASMRN